MKILLLLLGSLLFAAGNAAAAPTAACHCFQERIFDPARPEAVDPYLLATAHNSLFAAAFAIPKKEVVLARMRGTAAADLWIAHFAAQGRIVAAADLLAERRRGSTWTEVLKRHGISPAALGPAFAGGSQDDALAAAAVRTVLLDRLGAEPAALDRLRLAGASPQETILAVFLGRKSGREAPDLLADVRAGNTTWGTLLHTLGIPTSALEGEIGKFFR